MQPLNIEPAYRVVLPAAERLAIILVGVGGTGSTLALLLAGLASHARQKGVRAALTLVDPDHIAPASVGRQAYAPAEAQGGHLSKATSLAFRLNTAYGPSSMLFDGGERETGAPLAQAGAAAVAKRWPAGGRVSFHEHIHLTYPGSPTGSGYDWRRALLLTGVVHRRNCSGQQKRFPP